MASSATITMAMPTSPSCLGSAAHVATYIMTLKKALNATVSTFCRNEF